MIVTMPRPRFPYLYPEKTRHGKTVWYFRRDKSSPRIRINDVYGTTEFLAAYHAALNGAPPARVQQSNIGSLKWLVSEYMHSPAWASTAGETRKQFGYQFSRMVENSPDAILEYITRKHVVEGRDTRSAKPSDANKFVKASRKLFAWAVERELMAANPAADVALLRLPNVEDGFHTWTEDECTTFEARWPLGTRERLAFDILLYTGLRRSDAVRVGRQHVKNGVATLKTEKTGESVYIPILAPLLRSISATKTGDLTYLVTQKGTPFVKESFGTWFKMACRAAGVPGTAHGLRKAGAVRAAENGATESQLNAIFGWRDGSRESATYVRKASRARMAQASIKFLLRDGK